MNDESTTLTKPLLGVFNDGKWETIEDTSILKNGIFHIDLRGWQQELVDARRQSTLPHSFINCPTGAGKSKAALAVITDQDKYNDKLIIISAPQKEIGKGFLSSSGTPQVILGHTWTIDKSNQLCEGDTKNEDGNIEHIRKFLTNRYPGASLNDRVVICCHASLALMFERMNDDEKDKLLRNVKLCIDESHHSLSQEEVGNGLGNVVNYFLEHTDRELELFMMTATPFRGDNGSLVPVKYNDLFFRYDLDYGRHFGENCHGLEFTYDAVLHQHGESWGVVVEELMNKYLGRGDKVLVQIPHPNHKISSGDKFKELGMIYDAIGSNQTIDKNGIVCIDHKGKTIRVLDLITVEGREERLNYLRANHDLIDVVVGILMIKEGFDWPPANAGILIGQQGSLNAQIQLMGRMFRSYNNKGKKNGMPPVEIKQIFPYIDHEKLDRDDVREQVNNFMKVVYAALAMELVINPIHIELPTKIDSEGKEVKGPSTVKEFLLEHLDDTQYIDLMTNVLDDYRDWKANLEDEEEFDYSEKLKEIVGEHLDDLGIHENHDKIAEFIDKTIIRSAKFKIAALQGLDVANIDVDLMVEVEDPIESILMAMTNGVCGEQNIRDFQRLMKPVDSIRAVKELVDWMNSNKKCPSSTAKDKHVKMLGCRASGYRQNRNGDREGILTQEMIDILESCPYWEWDKSIDSLKNLYELVDWMNENKRIPSKKDDNILGSRVRCYRGARLGNSNTKLTQEMIDILESCKYWNWGITRNPLINTHELVNWMNENKRSPSQTDEDPYIKILGGRASGYRQIKKGNSRKGNLTQEMIDILESCPYWSWDGNNTMDNVVELVEWMNENKTIPSISSKDPYIKLLGGRVGRCRCLRKDLPKHIYDLLDSCPYWKWEIRKKPSDSLENLMNWINENKKTPSQTSNDVNIKKLGLLAGRFRKNKEKLPKEIFKVLDECPYWEWDKSIDSLKNLYELVDWMNENKRIPTQYDKDLYIKKLGQRASKYKEAKKGKGDTKLTQEMIDILNSCPYWVWEGRLKKKIEKYEKKKRKDKTQD